MFRHYLAVFQSWFFGLLIEKRAGDFSLLLSFGLLLVGIGLTLDCFYLLTGKLYKGIYYTALLILVVAYVLVVLGQELYESF